MSEARLIVGPFNRVEGDLEVRLDTSAGQVQRAEVCSPLYRGFERMLTGKTVADALTYAPRICGICSVSQSVAAAGAMAGLGPGRVPLAGRHAVNLIHAVENLADHFTHFYLFFMPDFAREIYKGESWYAEAAERFTAIRGAAAREALVARSAWMEIMGVLAGKWPHTLSIQPGGSTRAVSRTEKARLGAMVAQFRRFLERSTFGDDLDAVAALASRDALYAWAESHPASDFGRFVALSRALDLAALGRTRNVHLSFGAYPGESGHLFSAGAFAEESMQLFDPATIAEDVSHAWYAGDGLSTPTEPGPAPDVNGSDRYSWCKAPRLAGQVAEVGALSRQLIAGHPLARDLARGGANVEARVVARMLELSLVVPAMQRWVDDLDPDAPFIDHAPLDGSGTGAGLTEAARGSLGHWLRAEDGRIVNYQIIAPTTWNFSPRDAAGTPGPLEQALVGAPVRAGESSPVAVQHVVRSFDPCMVCTVH
ncbi:MAG: nickel-dependent hydrogenase large subunit [Pseudomonadota bacterium]